MASSIKATCHCGAVTITAPRKPEEINDCQCTICRRYGAAWAYYKTIEVDIQVKVGSSTREYVWGDRECGFNFCLYCGCMTHWYPQPQFLAQAPPEGLKMGINTRMMDPADLFLVNRKLNYDDLKLPIRGAKEEIHPEDQANYGGCS